MDIILTNMNKSGHPSRQYEQKWISGAVSKGDAESSEGHVRLGWLRLVRVAVVVGGRLSVSAGECVSV